jgi:predicted SAM-dependent methyltransferase
MNMSETSRCRERLKTYCSGYGLDIGYGGDPIVPTAITVDLPKPYAEVGEAPLNLGGDARNLYWFKDGVLDYIFSSHLLEDFPENETLPILREWLRVLKINGLIILYCPDEQKFRKHCDKTGQPYNMNHSNEHFSLDFLKDLLKNLSVVRIIHENPACEDYSFEMVIKKTKDLSC